MSGVYDRVVDYNKDTVKITNTEQLAKGIGCQYLLAIPAPWPGEYAAAKWLRKLPNSIPRGHVVIRF